MGLSFISVTDEPIDQILIFQFYFSWFMILSKFKIILQQFDPFPFLGTDLRILKKNQEIVSWSSSTNNLHMNKSHFWSDENAYYL